MIKQLVEKLLIADEPAERAALIAETTFMRLPEVAQKVARSCAILHWFDEAILGALLAGFTTGIQKDGAQPLQEINAATLYKQLKQFTFTETMPWGLTYHELTRHGLLALHVQDNPSLLQAGARFAMSTYMDHPKDLLMAAEAFYCAIVAGKIDTAYELFDQLFEKAGGQQNWEYLAGLFRLLEEAERFPFVDSFPWKAQHWLARGVTRYDQGNFDEAIADYSEAIHLNSSDAKAYICRGLALFEKGRTKDAITDYNIAIDLDPKDASAYNNRGLALAKQGELADAISDYNQTIRLMPNDNKKAIVYNNRGNVYRLLAEWTLAQADYLQALDITPNHLETWLGIADIARHRDEHQEWLNAVEKARPLIEYSDFYTAACFESIAGNIDRAIELLVQAVQVGMFEPIWAQRDPDLFWIRNDKRFQQLIDDDKHS